MQQAKKNGFSIKLFAQNDQRFIILITRKIWGMRFFKKAYEYQDRETAMHVFKRLVNAKFQPHLAPQAA